MAWTELARRRFGRLVVAAVLLAVASAAFAARRAFIQSFFPRGPGGAAPPALAAGLPAFGPSGALAPAPFVRVALLDGVSRSTALGLPHYDAVCKAGLDLAVDVGFPTVSLPVQSVLWTGLTQQQSGIEFVQARIDPPPAGSLPVREPSSAAIAESHQFISQSFGFARAWPAPDVAGPALAEWKAAPFEYMALGLTGSDTRLVFVHVLAVDSAGHKAGRNSEAYRAASEFADDLLGRMRAIDAAAHGSRSLWLVIADHGHRAAGGHGGEEAEVRVVRACLAGAGLAAGAARPGHLVHLVDVSRVLADALGQTPHHDAAGRPLLEALSAPEQPGATLPRPGPIRFAIAALLVGAALAATWLAARRSWRLPWWWVIAYLSVVALESGPTLSTPMIYRPLGQSIYMAALPGLVFLAVMAGATVRRAGPVRVALIQLLVPVALCAGCAVLCWGEPPLMPIWSALLSVFLVLLFTGAGVVALSCLAALVPSAIDRAAPSETTDREP